MSEQSSRRLDFFADENFSPRLVQILTIFAEHHVCEDKSRFHCKFTPFEKEFKRGTADETWMPQIATKEPKPVILSGDARILSNHVRLSALKSTGMHFVFLIDGFQNFPFSQQVIKALRGWDAVCAAVSKTSVPTVFELTVNSKVRAVKPLTELRSHHGGA